MPTTRMVGSKTETCTSGTKSTSTPLATELNFRDHAVGNPKRQLVPFLFAGFAVYTHDPEGQGRL